MRHFGLSPCTCLACPSVVARFTRRRIVPVRHCCHRPAPVANPADGACWAPTVWYASPEFPPAHRFRAPATGWRRPYSLYHTLSGGGASGGNSNPHTPLGEKFYRLLCSPMLALAGTPDGTRTRNPVLRRHLLFQLSFWGWLTWVGAAPTITLGYVRAWNPRRDSNP